MRGEKVKFKEGEINGRRGEGRDGGQRERERRSRDRQCFDPQHSILKQCTSTRVPHRALAQGYHRDSANTFNHQLKQYCISDLAFSMVGACGCSHTDTHSKHQTH